MVAIEITRDHRILRHLSAGPATKANLSQYHARRADGGRLSRQRMDAILLRLERDGYLCRTTYPKLTGRRQLTVYSVTAQGAQEVTRAYGIEPDHIQTRIPDQTHLRHELAVGECLRTLWAEADAGLYALDFAYGHQGLRDLLMEQGRGSVPMPDLRFRVIPAHGPPLVVNLEVDCDTHGRKQWMKRAAGWRRDTILVVAVTPRRVDQIARYVSATPTPVPWGLIAYEDLIRDGFMQAYWYWPAQKQQARLAL